MFVYVSDIIPARTVYSSPPMTPHLTFEFTTSPEVIAYATQILISQWAPCQPLMGPCIMWLTQCIMWLAHRYFYLSCLFGWVTSSCWSVLDDVVVSVVVVCLFVRHPLSASLILVFLEHRNETKCWCQLTMFRTPEVFDIRFNNTSMAISAYMKNMKNIFIWAFFK